MEIKPIYIEERGLMIANNNYRRWKIKNSDLYIGLKKF